MFRLFLSPRTLLVYTWEGGCYIEVVVQLLSLLAKTHHKCFNFSFIIL